MPLYTFLSANDHEVRLGGGKAGLYGGTIMAMLRGQHVTGMASGAPFFCEDRGNLFFFAVMLYL